MNIKEHIEAGHYPTDDKGRALVPTRDGDLVTIISTDHGSKWPITGRGKTWICAQTWTAEGGVSIARAGLGDLLPPPPRKVKVTAWASVVRGGTINSLHYHKIYADEDTKKLGNSQTVELTGEYEEEWS